MVCMVTPSFVILGNGKVHQKGFVIIDGSHLVLLFHRETLFESGPSREFVFVYGPFDETFLHLLHGGCKEISLFVSSPVLAGRNFWLKTPDLGSAPVRSKPFLMSSTKPTSSWPAWLRTWEVSPGQSLLSLSTSAILGLIEDFRSRSLVTSSVDKATHLLTSSVRSWATWWTVLLDRCAMLARTSFWDQGVMFCWVAKTNCFMQELFRWEMHTYRDLVVFAFFGTRDIPPFGSAK